jgi:hypothetical protein
MKKLLRFLIPLIATALLAALYLIFEVRILQLLSTWPKETEPQNILRVVFALASLLVLLLSYWVLVLKDKEKSLQSNLNSVENNFISNINELNHWKFHKKITLGVGSYHDVLTKHGDKFLRITLNDISQQDMPPPYESDSIPAEIKTQVATLCFDPGFFIYLGSRVKKITTSPFLNEECFYMPKNENQEAAYSVFFFHTEHVADGEQFFRCFVDHINPVKKEVDINIFFIWLKQARQKAQPDSQ